MFPVKSGTFGFEGEMKNVSRNKFFLICYFSPYMKYTRKIIIFRRIWNIQEKLFIQYSVQWGQIYFLNFFSVQNCQLFLFKNKWQQ